MVRIAIAGSSGEVAKEIIDALRATGRHKLILLSRKSPPAQSLLDDMSWCQVNYADIQSLKGILQGVHTVLSFITPQTDQENQAQRNLIDASVSAGVKRFAPSEWATSSFDHMPWYSGKAAIREYLEILNKTRKILEYSLFQPGLFVNYFTHPYKSAKYVNTFQTQIDFENRRAIVSETFASDTITLTTVQDVAEIVVKAVEYEGEWPVNGGIRGCDMSIEQLIKVGENLRGTFSINKLVSTDLKAGIINSNWIPTVHHPAIKLEEAQQMATVFLAGMTLGISAGALNVSDEWNQIFPDHDFTQPHDFLAANWKDKP